MAAEQVVAAGHEEGLRDQALQALESAGDTPAVLRARAEVLLLAARWDEAQRTFEKLLETTPDSEPVVRRTLERAEGARSATPGLRQLYARVLVATGASRLAMRELEQARAAGADPAASIAIADEMLEHDARNADLLLLRARVALDAKHHSEAATFLARALEVEPGRAEMLRHEIETSFEALPDPALGRLLVDLYVRLDKPEVAAETIRKLRDVEGVESRVLFDLSMQVATKFGFSATLLVVFLEAGLESGREGDARDAVSYYLEHSGGGNSEFAQLLTGLLHERPELASKLGQAIEGLPLPSEVRFSVALACLEGPESEAAFLDLQALVLEHPEMRKAALVALEAYLKREGDSSEALQLAADWNLQAGKTLESAQCLARALRVAPAEADAVCRRAERVLSRDPQEVEIWRVLILALVDAQRQRHARELCYRATQALPPEKLGFVHAAQAEMQLEAGQLHAAANELESALGCDNVPIERVTGALRRILAADAKNGYARYVLAVALLRNDGDSEEAIELLEAAVQHDDLLVDLALDLLTEHAADLERNGHALALEGTLHLRKCARDRGVAALERALRLAPELAAKVVQLLEVEWDRDPSNAELGMTFARALGRAGQPRRVCRLLSDLSRRFPEVQERCITELEVLVDKEPLAEAHRVLWEIRLQRGERDAALQQLVQAVESSQLDDESRGELLEAALRQMPATPWIECRLAEFEARCGHEKRAEELLRGLLERDASAWEMVRTSLRSAVPEVGKSEPLDLLEVDCLLAGDRGLESLEALRRFRDGFAAARAAAVARYRTVVERGSASPGANLDLGSMLKEDGDIEGAVAALEAGLKPASAAEAGPRDANTGKGTAPAPRADHELRLTLASLYVDLGRERESKELMAGVLEVPGEHTEAYRFLARVSRQSTVAKLKNLRESISKSPGNLRARLELARLSLVSADFEAAREALRLAGDSPAVEGARRYLLARSYADEDQSGLALAVLRSVELDDVADADLRSNVVYLQGVCCERLGRWGEAHSHYLDLLSQTPGFKDTRERARVTYQQHLETALETRAHLLEKRTQLDATLDAM
jgi:tetratricopeptide (TPR) repeat protein